MGATTGFAVIGDYATPSGDPAKCQALIDLIANPDSGIASSGAVSGGAQGIKNTYLDEMSPGAAAQLIVELTALKAVLT